MANRNKQNKTLSKRQRRCIPILLQARNVSEGCERARIGRGAYYEWLQQPAFKAEYERQTDELVQESITNLKLMFTRAGQVLNDLMDSRNPAIRFKAASRIQDSCEKIFMDRIEQRLSFIEEKIKLAGENNEH
jgi:hypothetical protein